MNLTAVAGIRPLPGRYSIPRWTTSVALKPLATGVVDVPKRRELIDAGYQRFSFLAYF